MSNRIAKKDEVDAAASTAATNLAAHEIDTTSVHGIADTSVLETTSGAQAKVDAAIAALIAGAPGALDTLNELAAAFGNDANFATTVTNALAGKQPLDSDLTAIAALTTTSYGRAFLALADAAAGRTALGLGTAATHATGDYDAAGAAAAAQSASQPLDSDLTAIAALTTTSYGRAFLALADAAAGRTALGLGTAATHATGDYDAAGAAAAAQAASQPLDSDLTTIAGLTATTDNIIQSVGSAWASRTPAQVKAALAIGESDVTNLTTDLGALQTQTAVQAAQIEVRRLADLGQYVCSGLALTPNATPTKLDMAAGTQFAATTELNAAAQSAIATTIASLADATNPKWVVVELDSSNVVQFNQGTAAAAPAFPTIATTRTPLGFLYIPANATNVDTLLTTNNGLAKLIDARVVRAIHTGRLLFTDTAETVAALTTNSTNVSVLAAPFSLPANSLNVGDTIVVEASGTLKIAGSSNSTVIVTATPAGAIATITTAAQTFDATNNRRWTLRVVYVISAIGNGSTKFEAHVEFDLSAASATQPALSAVRYVGGASSTGFNSTAAISCDLVFALGTANASSTAALRQYSITKFPA